MSKKTVVCVTFLIFFISIFAQVPLFAQSKENTTAVPYGPAEFPYWLKNIRRSEIITFGSLPFVTLLSSMSYDLYRYTTNDFSTEYRPWPFKKKAVAIPLTEEEQKNIFLASLGISFCFALIDFSVQTIKDHKNQKHAITKEKQNEAVLKIIPISTIDIKEDSSEGLD